MKIMKFNIRTWIVAAVLMASFPSCKKYLDVVPDNVATIDYAFRNRNEAENYLFTCYATMQRSLFYAWSDPAFTTGGAAAPFPCREQCGHGLPDAAQRQQRAVRRAGLLER